MMLLMEGLTLDDPLRTVIEHKLSTVLNRGRRLPIAARVGFTKENGPKGGAGTRCAVTVELPRRVPVHAEAVADNPRLALDAVLETLNRELKAGRERRRDAARRPKKYYVARQGWQTDGEAALPPARRRRRSA
jgi:ribosome-associated translation inhibitor RaiA